MDIKLIEEALLIRRTEELLLRLFKQGRLSGTIHTCVGQEMSAVCVLNHLGENDYVFSNHRCHGHYISYSKDPKSLIAELMGKKTGACSGFGGSQHLHYKNFFSNGIQGGMVPIALGTAFGQKIENKKDISVVFVGDGTMGQGVVYESMNMASLFEVPLLIVCEDNNYAQSTHRTLGIAGEISGRPASFGIEVFSGNTDMPDELFYIASDAVEYVRSNRKPAFLYIKTNRLNPHSKGDDFRDLEELEQMQKNDFINKFASENANLFLNIDNSIKAHLEDVLGQIDKQEESSLGDYLPLSKQANLPDFVLLDEIDQRVVERINQFFKDIMRKDEKVLFIGEDVLSPYGGAFKVARDLSDLYPGRVVTTPISEQAITGMSNGLAIFGLKPYLEIMFGDFITLTLDQIINHASKFKMMFNQKVECAVKIRTPMGGGRGYGATHSQSLERFLIGIDGINVVSINGLVDPYVIYKDVHADNLPTIILENKSIYGDKIGKKISGYEMMRSVERYPQVKISPIGKAANLTVVTYGESSKKVVELLHDMFYEAEAVCDVFVVSQIYPIKDFEFLKSVELTKKLLVVEEGISTASFGSEIIALANSMLGIKFKSEKIGAKSGTIPAQKNIEKDILVNKNMIIKAVTRLFDA